MESLGQGWGNEQNADNTTSSSPSTRLLAFHANAVARRDQSVYVLDLGGSMIVVSILRTRIEARPTLGSSFTNSSSSISGPIQ